MYTNWYTVQIHLLEHSRVKICHRGATGLQRGWALARARICMYGGTTFDTNTHFLPNFRVALQLNRSTKVNEILVDVSSMIYDCLYKFWAFQFIRNIPFLQFENRDFGKFYKFYIIYAGKLHCRNFISADLGLPAALRAAPLRWFCSLRSQNHRERLPAF